MGTISRVVDVFEFEPDIQNCPRQVGRDNSYFEARSNYRVFLDQEFPESPGPLTENIKK